MYSAIQHLEDHMSESQQVTMQLLIRVKPSVHQRLVQRTLRRSAELARRVGMAYVLNELLDQADQVENPEQRPTALFASVDGGDTDERIYR
jgi:hypothetical protein